MEKVQITTPENIEVEYTLADVASRTAATLIDLLIQSVFLIILGLAVFFISFFAPEFWELQYGWIIGAALLIFAILSYGYYIFLELGMNGRTPGKKLLKLRVIRRNGQPLTFRHAAIRNLFKVLLDSFGIGMVFIFFSKERRRLGDLAASTIVVMDEIKTKPVSLQSLQNINEHFSYYFTEEELNLLREYMARKGSLADGSQLRSELMRYFAQKLESAGAGPEWEQFIREL